MPAELTPMMKQYHQMKAEHPDCILMFRLGDFYEMFNEDAKLVSRSWTSPSPPGTGTSLLSSAPPCAACPITRWRPISPDSSPKATRWPSVSRWRTLPPPRVWWTGTSSASSPRAPSWRAPCWRRGETTSSPPSVWTPAAPASASATSPPARFPPPPLPGRAGGSTS